MNENGSDAASDGTVMEVMGTAIIDATCSPSNIRYPQDYSLLNEAREKLEEMIDFFHSQYAPWKKPRTYRRIARKEYLELAKSKKRSAKKIRSVIRKQLGYVRRDLGYLEAYMSEGYALDKKFINNYLVILQLYEQQKYMFDNKTHRVENRIVSIHQPYIRPIVRGKVKTPVEFGAKYDVSIDEKGHARLEKISFDPYNESTILTDVLERYKERTGHYPARVLVDQIYRTRKNIDFCKDHGIRISGPKLGRPSKDISKNKEAAKTEYKDNKDRIEVERFFSLEKGSNGAGLIMTKLKETIDQLTAQLEEKSVQIETLQSELASKNITIEEQTQKIEQLNTNVTELTTQNEEKAKVVAEQDKQINTAWFVFGTKSELKEQNILNKKEVLKEGSFNKNYFTEIDIRTQKEIKLYSKSAKLLTSHPSGSYTLAKDAKGQYVLKINNPNTFWSVSRYLVIQVK